MRGMILCLLFWFLGAGILGWGILGGGILGGVGCDDDDDGLVSLLLIPRV